VRATFLKVWKDNSDSNKGEQKNLNDVYDECLDEMNDFKDDAEEAFDELIDYHGDDASKQQDKAKSDFVRLIESSMIKIHGIEHLTPEERADLQDQLIGRRNGFQSSVGSWARNLVNDMNDLNDNNETTDGEGNITSYDGMKQEMQDKIRDFV